MTECNLLVLGWKRPADGYRIALIGATSLHVGGSALDATTDCGSAMPDQADPAILTIIKKKSGGCVRRNYRYLVWGLLEILAVIAPLVERLGAVH